MDARWVGFDGYKFGIEAQGLFRRLSFDKRRNMETEVFARIYYPLNNTKISIITAPTIEITNLVFKPSLNFHSLSLLKIRCPVKSRICIDKKIKINAPNTINMCLSIVTIYPFSLRYQVEVYRTIF